MIRPDFGRAKRRGEWRRVLSFVTGQPTLLLPFDLVRDKVGMQSSSYSGIREIEIDKVIGSVNRYREFDREFLPKRWRTADRWSRVRESFEEGPGYSPIKVYQVGDAYFVVDGNHRVSVARQLGIRRIEAEITRFEPTVPIDEHTDVRSLIVKAEYGEFLRATRLDAMRPRQRIEFTRPGRYAILLEHIEKHRYFKSLDEGRGISYEEAVASWYDNVYSPLVEILRSEGMLKSFPKRTEADLYVWISKHVYFLRQRFEDGVGLDAAARAFAARYKLPRTLRFLEGIRDRMRADGSTREERRAE